MCFQRNSCKFVENEFMNKNNHNVLESPAVSYGSTIRVGDLHFQPMENVEDSLRAKGYISLEEFEKRFSNKI